MMHISRTKSGRQRTLAQQLGVLENKTVKNFKAKVEEKEQTRRALEALDRLVESEEFSLESLTRRKFAQAGIFAVDNWSLDSGELKAIIHHDGDEIHVRLNESAGPVLGPYTAFGSVRREHKRRSNEDLFLNNPERHLDLDIDVANLEEIDGSVFGDVIVDYKPQFDEPVYFALSATIPKIQFDLGVLLKLYETTEWRKAHDLPVAPESAVIEKLLEALDIFHDCDKLSEGVSYVDIAGCEEKFMRAVGCDAKSTPTVIKECVKAGKMKVCSAVIDGKVVACQASYAGSPKGYPPFKKDGMLIDVSVDPKVFHLEEGVRTVFNMLVQVNDEKRKGLRQIYTTAHSPQHKEILRNAGFEYIGPVSGTDFSVWRYKIK